MIKFTYLRDVCLVIDSLLIVSILSKNTGLICIIIICRII